MVDAQPVGQCESSGRLDGVLVVAAINIIEARAIKFVDRTLIGRQYTHLVDVVGVELRVYLLIYRLVYVLLVLHTAPFTHYFIGVY